MQRRIRPRAGARRAAIIMLALGMMAAVTLLAGAQNTPVPAETGTASNGELEITVKAGFGRLEVNSWNGAWVPFRINIVNQGPAIVGRLIVHTESNNNGPTSQARKLVKEIQLPPAPDGAAGNGARQRAVAAQCSGAAAPRPAQFRLRPANLQRPSDGHRPRRPAARFRRL